ncbi:MAG: type I DNA topoisomerase [Patescibacteria group bacterium]
MPVKSTTHKKLVIVESPTKARTISRFVGGNFIVDSSYGHVRDLPRSKLGIDVEGDFTPQYLIPQKARPVVAKLKKEMADAEGVILATDEDREGEAIAWHLIKALGLDEQKTKKDKQKTIERIVFHEITEKAIKEAIAHPRDLDMNLVDAQQARRVLDRIVGYKLSPFLWKKVFGGLSAGRVQSVAVRLIVEREREIEKFKPQEYWTIAALLRKSQAPNHKLQTNSQSQNADSPDEFEAKLIKIGDKTLDKFAIPDENTAKTIVNALDAAEWTVERVDKKSVSKNPLPPYTTSTLQQDAFRRLRFSAKRTMMLAQQLYEGIAIDGGGSVGLITYMRTDSLNMSADAISAGRDFLAGTFGEKYVSAETRRFRTKSKGAQEAHEAIRPTDPFRTPESVRPHLEPSQYKLYDLVWRRFIATQMPAAIFDATTVDVSANLKSQLPSASSTNDQLPTTNYTFRSTGQIMRFDGFLKIYPIKTEDITLPDLTEKERLALQKLAPEQHFTIPPPRYTEASLVKILEQHGIGRPSTYAPTISTIQDRGYVERFERKYLKPTETGCMVNDILVLHFPDIVDIEFTARMEDRLDQIAEGQTPWAPVIKEFYGPFAKNLEQKYEEVQKTTVDETTDEICDKCGKPMIIKRGRFGKFLACSGFPDCKNAKTLKKAPESTGLVCPKCAQGDIIVRYTKKGRRPFYGCSRYPDCDYATWDDPRKVHAMTDARESTSL